MANKWIVTAPLALVLLFSHTSYSADIKSNKTDRYHDIPSPIEALRYPIKEESNRIIKRQADRYDQASEAYKNKNPVKAHAIWYTLAVKGNRNAQFRLGKMREEGQGIPVKITEAVAWYRKAAVQGHADAMFALGTLLNQNVAYLNVGYPLYPDYDQTRIKKNSDEPNWFAQAAAAYAKKDGLIGEIKQALALIASVHLIDPHFNHTSTDPKMVKAWGKIHSLINKISEQDKILFEKNATAAEFYLLAKLLHPISHIDLSKFDRMGDEERAQYYLPWYRQGQKWMKKSAENGYIPAMLGYMNNVATGLPKAYGFLLPDKLNNKLQLSSAKAYKWSVILKLWTQKHGGNYVSAVYSEGMGNLLRSACSMGEENYFSQLKAQRLTIERNDVEDVITWLDKHGLKLNSVEQYNVHCYFGDTRKANKILREAANNNDPDAQLTLASLYYYGRYGYKKDRIRAQEIAEKAIATYVRLSEHGNINASVKLAAQLTSGTYIKKDQAKAFSLFKSAAEQGYPKAYWWMYISYVRGIGVKNDEGKAYYWYARALVHYPYLHYYSPLKRFDNKSPISPELASSVKRYEKELVTLYE